MFISHKVLRWLAPEFMIVAFLGSWMLANHGLYFSLALLQTVVYLLAGAGLLWQDKGRAPFYVYVPFYICTMNAAAFVALFRFLGGQRKGLWKKAER
jgi:hypothetical protein